MKQCVKKRLLENKEGSALIEFALLMPVFFFLIFGIIEIFTLMLAEGLMESATRQASRSGLTGYVPDSTTRDEYILQQIRDEVFFVDPEQIKLETLIYSNFGDINQAEPYTDENGDGSYDVGEPYTDSNGNGQWDFDMGVAGIGNGGDIVVYRISYDWEFMTPFIGELLFEDGEYKITTSAVVRNEPF